MNDPDRTIRTYDESAAEWAAQFDARGTRSADIQNAFSLLSAREQIRALEIGCGHGRDAGEIAQRSTEYLGIDGSKEFIAMAQKRHPNLRFDVARAETAAFPPKLDIVFAFASLLHVSPDNVRAIFRRLYASLMDGGVVELSLQEGEGERTRHDALGTRVFHLYTPEAVKELAGDGFDDPYLHLYELNERRWFEIALRKKEKSEQ